MRAAADASPLRLAYIGDATDASDRLRRVCDAYVAAFRRCVEEHLAGDGIACCRMAGALSGADHEPRLRIAIDQSGADLIVRTKIVAAVNAATTYLGLMMDGLRLGPDLVWGDVVVETDFSEPDRSPAPRNVRANLRLVTSM